MVNQIDPLLRRLDYETLEIMVAFSEQGTFKGVEESIGTTERLVRSRLQELDALVQKRSMTPILRKRNSRRWELTPAGITLAEHARSLTFAMNSAIKSLDSVRRIEVVTTSNCCRYLAEVNVALRQKSPEFALLPVLERSSEISSAKLPPHIELGFFSELMATAGQEVSQGVPIEVPGGVLLPIDVDELYLLSDGETFGVPFPRGVDIIDAGVTLCVPSGGVPWDFLQRELEDWQIHRYKQHFPITDLYGGLKVLETGLAGPHAAMVVHGLTVDHPALSGLRNPHLQVLHDDPEVRLRAVTGLFRRTEASTAAIQAIWDTALKQWPRQER